MGKLNNKGTKEQSFFGLGCLVVELNFQQKTPPAYASGV
jgi:hypothetical protein